MLRPFTSFVTVLAALFCFTVPMVAPALAALGEPVQGGLNLQASGSPVKDIIETFHNQLLVTITVITVIVLALLLFVIIRFNHRIHKTPDVNFTHHTKLEVIWTAIPVVILLVLAYPSFQLLYYSDRTPNPEMTLKVEGRQWYWNYEYPDHGGFKFDARGLWDTPQTTDEQARQLAVESKINWLIDNGDPRRLLETDNRIVLPVDTNIRILITAADVIHSFAVPALALKTDAIPGHTNETWVRISKPGVYYGQCSEICGTNHAFMPIAIEAVSKEDFAKWAENAKTKFVADNGVTLTIAQR